VLRAAVAAEAERVAAAALAPIHDRDLSSAARSKAALALLDAVDPPLQAAVEMTMPLDADGIAKLGLHQLRQLASQAES